MKLKSFLNLEHRMVLLAKIIDWSYFQKAFEPSYAKIGLPAHSIGLMVGRLMLKRIYNLGDKNRVERRIENPTMQYFAGAEFMKYESYCYPFGWSCYVALDG
ncbi:MAG: hypothetical protein OXC92_08075 [Flavobacteriaceae bacterium]|nr:hypothetical protein [Flavobacteriaceae bacterium]MCY4253552.1 hypothetical protein [Flavobacteriaceae bacterium]